MAPSTSRFPEHSAGVCSDCPVLLWVDIDFHHVDIQLLVAESEYVGDLRSNLVPDGGKLSGVLVVLEWIVDTMHSAAGTDFEAALRRSRQHHIDLSAAVHDPAPETE